MNISESIKRSSLYSMISVSLLNVKIILVNKYCICLLKVKLETNVGVIQFNVDTRRFCRPWSVLT